MEVLAWPADLTREAEVTALLGAIAARYGRLDLLFNNAGVNVPPTPCLTPQGEGVARSRRRLSAARES